MKPAEATGNGFSGPLIEHEGQIEAKHVQGIEHGTRHERTARRERPCSSRHVPLRSAAAAPRRPFAALATGFGAQLDAHADRGAGPKAVDLDRAGGGRGAGRCQLGRQRHSSRQSLNALLARAERLVRAFGCESTVVAVFARLAAARCKAPRLDFQLWTCARSCRVPYRPLPVRAVTFPMP
jgi:hypothetical protein